MPPYRHPGVYVKEVPSGSKPIEGVATSVAAFVGEPPEYSRAIRTPIPRESGQ